VISQKISAEQFFEYALAEKEKAGEEFTVIQKEALKTQMSTTINDSLEDFANTVIAKKVLYKKLGLDPEEDQVQVVVVSTDTIKLTNVGLDHEYNIEKEDDKWKIDGASCDDEKLKEEIGKLNVITNDEIVNENENALVEKLGLEEWKSNLKFENEDDKNTLRVYSSGKTDYDNGYVKIEVLDNQKPGNN
jgi:hypothetical protein